MTADPGHRGDPARAIADRMAWQLARCCRPDDVVIVGVATPLATAAVLLAREYLMPELTVLLGTAVAPRVHDISASLADPATANRLAAGSYTQAEVLDALQRGRITLQFVSPAQVDGDGAINASRVPGPDGLLRRLPGSLALADTAALAGRLVAYRAAHDRRFLVDRVPFVTGAGRSGGHGIHAVLTDRALLAAGDGGFRLAAIAAEAGTDAVLAGCGFELGVPEPPATLEHPPADAVELLDRVIDPHGIRLLEIPAGRAAAAARWEHLVDTRRTDRNVRPR